MENQLTVPTKFEILCSAYKKAVTESKEYLDNCHSFSVELWKRMIEYFQVPSSQLSFYTVNSEGEYEITSPPLFNALILQPDSFFEMGFGITVYETEGAFPQETIIVGLLIKKGMNCFIIKLNDHDEEFIIEENNSIHFNKFFDYLHNIISTSYSTGIQTFLDQETSKRHIGFKIGQK